MAKSKRSPALDIVERIVRNMPIKNIEWRYVDTIYDRLYFAYGKDGEGKYHGVWAFTRGPGMARPIEFAPNQLKSLVVKELVEDGLAMLRELHGRGMLEKEFWRGG